MTGKKVMLIGGGGFIGTHLMQRFHAMQYRNLVVLDDFRNRGKDYYVDALLGSAIKEEALRIDKGLKFFSDLDNVDGLIEGQNPDIVVYLAGPSTVEEASAAPAFQEANLALMAALESCGRLKKSKRPLHFVYISSSMVYGHFRKEPVNEAHPIDPINLYGVMKVTGEKLVGMSGLPYTIIRPTAVYGEYDSNNRVIKKFCEAALLGKPLEVLGNEKLDFTHVADTAQGIFLAATSDAEQLTYNISSGKAIPILEAAQIVAANSPRESTVVVHYEKGTDTTRPSRGALDISKAKRDLGYLPRADFETQVKRYMHHLSFKWENAHVEDAKYYVHEKKTRKSA